MTELNIKNVDDKTVEWWYADCCDDRETSRLMAIDAPADQIFSGWFYSIVWMVTTSNTYWCDIVSPKKIISIMPDLF